MSGKKDSMKLIKDSIPLDKKFPFRIFKVTLPKTDYGPLYYHWHSYFEITYVEKGRGQYCVNGKEYTMEAGDIIIFNNVEPHGWNLPDSDMKVTVMIFSPEFVAEKLAFFDQDYLRPFVERGSNFKNRIGREEPFSKMIQADIMEIYKEWEEKKDGYPLMIKADILRILTILIRTSQDGEKPQALLKEKQTAMKRVEEAFTFIDNHYREKITLEQVAASVFMSPNYFSTYFKRVANMSFSEYLIKLRLAKAKNQLRTTDKSVTEIALDCGFHNMSNFYHLYKTHIGKAPLEER